MSNRLTGRLVTPRVLALFSGMLLATGDLAFADDVELGLASITRRNGAVIAGNLLKVKGGEVRISSQLKPLEFKPGEVTEIMFEQFLEEPAVSGTVRKRYFYDAETKAFERQRIMLSVGPWAVQQIIKFETVTYTQVQKDSSGNSFSATVDREEERPAPEATASAMLANKLTQTISAKLQLLVSATDRPLRVIEKEYVLQPSQKITVTIPFRTNSLKITDVVVQDVFNRLVISGSDRSLGQEPKPPPTPENLIKEPAAEKAPLSPPAQEPVASVDLLVVPSEAEVAETVILIREAYADDYKGEPGVLIKTLKSAASQTDEAVRKFALLQEGEQAAVWAGDPSQAFELLEKRGSLFKIDVPQSSLALIKKFTKPTGETTKKLVERLLQLSRTAIEADQFPFAKEAVELGVVHARALVAEERAKNTEGDGVALLNELALQKDIIQRSELLGDYEKALATLQKAGAGACEREHTVVGRYRCLARDDWETGLASLAKGEAGPLRVAASKELLQKSGEKQVPKELLAVAGEWWKLSEKPKPPEDEASLSESDLEKLREHSSSLYADALPHLIDPLDRALATKRSAGSEGQGSKKPTGPEPKKPPTNSIGLELIELSAGKFTMGDMLDTVDVTLTKPFGLGKTEVTQGQFKKVMGTEPWLNQGNVQIGEDNAASYVDWNDATAFCQRLTDTDHKNGKLPAGESYRLPTEAEWEYACRAGTTTAFSFGDDKEQFGENAWYRDNAGDVGERFAHAVGLKKPNLWGLHDMHGNVREWCSDCYGKQLGGGTDPVGPGGGSSRVFRGGSWGIYSDNCRSAFRDYCRVPSLRSNGLGFRVARSQSAQ